MTRRCPIVGLTGGVASGKSAAEQAFRALGVPVLDADQVSREVVAPGSEGLAAVIAAFGESLRQPDGQLDRRKLRERVFANDTERRRLEDLLHPLIGIRIERWCAAQTAAYAVVSIAILLESRFRTLVDFVLVIDVESSLQIERLMARDGIDETLARQMLAAQSSRDARRQAADGLIDNGSTLGALQQQVQHWDQHFRTRWQDTGTLPKAHNGV